jgi:hypothetical protein
LPDQIGQKGSIMRFLSGRSRVAKILITATTAVATAIAGVFIGVGVANAGSTQSNTQINTMSIATKTDTTPFQTSSTSWVTLTSMTVTSASNMFNIDVRFSANTKCNGVSDGYCTVRLIDLGNGREMEPAAGTSFSWQFQGGNETWGARSMERTLNNQATTSFTVAVQVAVVNGANLFKLQNWTLVAQMY